MRSLIVGFAVVAPIVLLLLWPHAPLAGVAILALSHALLLYPTVRPNVQWFGPVVTGFETGANEVWLTIDDGPTEDTTAILDALESRGAKATFFVKGTLVREHEELVREIVSRGHTVANHSDTHPAGRWWCLPPAGLATEIDGCAASLTAVVPGPQRWFRAPVGMKNPGVHPALARRGLRLIGWSVRSFDAVRDEFDKVMHRIQRDTQPGGIIVMHQGREWSARTIAAAVDQLQARGYSFVIPDDTRLKTKR
ncbi:MAG: peptidoglycan-N-acetylglucosamine deacetylase [Acidobacteriota bacterium]|jgi:peptidoglycan/xylan/chitin deacetylase (PgdA/CDA1 family)|nr:peptidoglycan-N-acetylglucosamine deacetylase [Acidobacteriota bacterium]